MKSDQLYKWELYPLKKEATFGIEYGHGNVFNRRGSSTASSSFRNIGERRLTKAHIDYMMFLMDEGIVEARFPQTLATKSWVRDSLSIAIMENWLYECVTLYI